MGVYRVSRLPEGFWKIQIPIFDRSTSHGSTGLLASGSRGLRTKVGVWDWEEHVYIFTAPASGSGWEALNLAEDGLRPVAVAHGKYKQQQGVTPTLSRKLPGKGSFHAMA